jgi:hypothetical protein
VDFVVQCTNEHRSTIRTPTNTGRGAPNLKYRHALLLPFLSPFPNLNRPIIRRSRNKLDTRAARKRPVERVDNPVVGAYFSCALSSGDVCNAECVVGGDGVERGREEGPLEVQDGGFA